MVLIMKNIILFLFLLPCLFTLTGCPGQGDRLQADEITTVQKSGNNLCFLVPDAGEYQPTILTIGQRNKPAEKMWRSGNPDLKVEDGQLCIPPALYTFPEQGQFVIRYVLKSGQENMPVRSVVAAIEVSKTGVRNLPLQSNEGVRPYQ